MTLIRNLFKISVIRLTLVAVWLAACAPSPAATTSPTSSPAVETDTPTLTATHTPRPTQTEILMLTPNPDMWEIQKCHKAPSVIGDLYYNWMTNYIGDIEGRGEVDMLLTFTESNEILGFVFNFERVREYRVSGCVEDRAFMMWLQQGDTVEAIIQGEFPATDPRGHFSSSEMLGGEVITGLLMEKSTSQGFSVYLKEESSTAGTIDHRFQLAGVEDDTVILNASRQFIAAVVNDNRAQVVDMIRFPVDVWFRGSRAKLQTPESFLAYYNAIFGDGFKERLAITFPNYLMADAGNFIGTISQFISGGGGISFDEHGKVIAIYNWEKPAPTPTATQGGKP
jgi:hypothetical protein